MGGRPWQSKGCRACRRRKIKCDGQRPACAKCTKRGIECPGYQKPHIFNVHQETFRRGKKMSPHELIRQSNQDIDSLILRSVPFIVTPMVHVNAPSISRDQIFSVFLDHYFPAGHYGSPYGVELWHYLIGSFSMLPQKTHMLEIAITAISCVYLGKVKNDSRVFQHGLQLYTQAIREMSSMIYRNIYTDDIIYTTVIFQEIENCHCPQGFQTWLAHTAGTNAIMRHYQNVISANPIVNAIYDQWQKFRILCLTMGRDLDDEEYEYCHEPSEGRPLVELINIFAGFTPLSTGFKSVGQSDRDACEKLLDGCLAQKRKLSGWYARRQDTIGGAPFISTKEFCCTGIDPVDVAFGRPYSFVSLDNAMLHIFYWTAMMIISPMVYRARIFAESLEHGSKFCGDPVSDPKYQTFADQIVRSVPFIAQDKNRLLGPHMVMFGVAGACKAYINIGIFEKFDWCQKILGSFGDRGFEACEHYRRCAWDHWNSRSPCPADFFSPVSVRGELDSGSPPFEAIESNVELSSGRSCSWATFATFGRDSSRERGMYDLR